MNIALVMPKSTFLELPMIFQPLGLFYLAARLESLGHHCDFYDLNVDEFPEDVYDEIWVSATSPQLAEVKRIGRRLLSYTATSVLGGASVWANPASCDNIGYDCIVGGEADSPDGIQSALNGYGHIAVPVSRTLDWVLPPVRRWSRKYSSQLTNLDGIKVDCTTMFTSRGCPLECAFCESGRHGVIWDRLTRYEPLDVVEYQIKEAKELGYGALAYYDDILPLHKSRTLELMKLHRKYGMIWRCFLRSDIICKQGGYDYLKELRDGGLVEIFVGVESASNDIKNNITKKTTIEQDTEIVSWCKQLGIRCKTSFILGLPGESQETMEATRRWILHNRPDRVQVGRLIPFPGTPLGNHPENYDIKIERNVPDDWFYRQINRDGFRDAIELSKELAMSWRDGDNLLDSRSKLFEVSHCILVTTPPDFVTLGIQGGRIGGTKDDENVPIFVRMEIGDVALLERGCTKFLGVIVKPDLVAIELPASTHRKQGQLCPAHSHPAIFSLDTFLCYLQRRTIIAEDIYLHC